MEFTNEKLGCSFTIPDRPTVRQQLAYYSEIAGVPDNERLERYWIGARGWIQSWKCDALPDYKADLETLTNPTQAQILLWAGLQVFGYFNQLEDIPPN